MQILNHTLSIIHFFRNQLFLRSINTEIFLLQEEIVGWLALPLHLVPLITRS